MPSNAEIREANINSALDDVEDGGSFEQGNEDTTRDEPQTKTFDRDEYVNDTYAEGAEESVIEELAGKEDITLDDLRQIPGAEGLSDAQLQAEWDKAQKEAGVEGDDPSLSAKELPFPVYDAQGNKVTADKVTLDDLISGKVQIGYNAMDKEQRKTLTEVLRNASQGHWNEHRYNTVQGQYREAAQKLATLEKESASYKDMQGQWTAALNALAFGDNKPMANLLNAYKAELGKTGNAPPAGFVAEDTIRQQRELEQAGLQWWTSEGLPQVYDIATKYGADRAEVQRAAEFYINAEGSNITQQRISEIFKYDVPMLLEQHGYASGNVPAGGPQGNRSRADNSNNNETADLRKQIEAQAAAIAELKNNRTAA